ncbi:MAG: HIT family protein [Candidatus Moranbacteria bacterium]|jgi:diadenosine tetraphosphate (Ap4A) HIT family hydrolase|nr:HIT family protein [Candidatus Moranbacteria bacterium]
MVKYKSKTEEGACIFCEIAASKIETPGIFWEDKNFMAFLSIFPNTQGATVLIPKKHYASDVLDLPDEVLKKIVLAAKKVSKILIKKMPDVGRVGLVMEGTGINHAHIKLYPMHKTGHMKKGVWKQYSSHRTDYYEKYEGFVCSNDGPREDDKKIKKLADKLKKN